MHSSYKQLLIVEVCPHDNNTPSWANINSSDKVNNDGFTVVNQHKEHKPSSTAGNSRESANSEPASYHPRRLIGTKVNDGAGDQPAVVTVQRRLMAFVRRLQKDITEEQLCLWLVAVGIQGIKCKKLVSKDGKQFQYNTTFFVSCVAVLKDLFYNEQTWPAGCEL